MFGTLETCALGLLAHSVRLFSFHSRDFTIYRNCHFHYTRPVHKPSAHPDMCILSDTNQKKFCPLQLEGVTSVVRLCQNMSTNSCYEIG